MIELTRLMAVPTAGTAVIGDGENDVDMFAQAGLSIAMGNANAAVKDAADFVTGSNEDDGVAVSHRVVRRGPQAGSDRRAQGPRGKWRDGNSFRSERLYFRER